MKQYVVTCQLQYNQVRSDTYLLTGQLDYKRLSVKLCLQIPKELEKF